MLYLGEAKLDGLETKYGCTSWFTLSVDACAKLNVVARADFGFECLQYSNVL